MKTNSRPLVAAAPLRRVQAAGVGALVRIVAPAGSGVSALLDHWAHSEGHRSVRVEVTPDQGPGGFLDAVDAALHARELPRPPRVRRNGSEGPVAQLLGPSRSTLVVTSTEHLTNHALVELLVRHLCDDPHELTVVLAGQSLPTIDWTPIIRARRIVTIDGPALRLTPTDVLRSRGEDFAGGLDAAAARRREAIHRLVHFTDGWYAGVQVGLLDLPSTPSADHPEPHLAGSPWESVRAYVRDHVVAGWDDDDIVLLQPLAVAGSASDLPAILQDDALRELASQGRLPMLRPGDAPDDPPMLAPVLREVLVQHSTRLYPTQVAGIVDLLLEQAAARDDPVAALSLATSHHRDDVVVEVMTRHWPDIVLGGHMALASTALDRIPPATLVQRAELLMLRATWSGVLGNLGEALHWMRFSDAVRPADAPVWSPGGIGPRNLVDFAFGLTGRSVDLLTPLTGTGQIPPLWRGLYSVLHGFDLAVRGNPNAGIGVLAAAAPFTASQPMIELNRQSSLALAASLAGRLRERDAALNAAESIHRRAGEGLARTLLLTSQLAERDIRLGRRESAASRLQASMDTLRANGSWFRTPRVIAIAQLIGVAQALGHDEIGDELAEMIEPLLGLVGGERGLSPELIDSIARTATSSEHEARPQPQAATARLSAAEFRVLAQLATPKPVPRIAADLFVSVATVRSHVRSIYVKLAVSNRVEAVEKGREHGLLL